MAGSTVSHLCVSKYFKVSKRLGAAFHATTADRRFLGLFHRLALPRAANAPLDGCCRLALQRKTRLEISAAPGVSGGCGTLLFSRSVCHASNLSSGPECGSIVVQARHKLPLWPGL